MLACTAATGVVGMPGCIGETLEGVEGVGQKSREFGEVAKHRGVEVMPTHWMATNQITFDVDQGMTQTRTPPTGAEFLLTYVQAANEGDNRRELPSRSSTFGGTSGRDIRVYYSDEETDTNQFEDISSAYEVDGVRLTPYLQSRLDQDATGEVFPSVSIEGWIVAEITEGFNVEETTIEAEWGDEDELEAFEWVYSTAAEISPEEINDNEGKTTEI